MVKIKFKNWLIYILDKIEEDGGREKQGEFLSIEIKV